VAPALTTVMMPAYRAERTLRAAVESVFAQTLPSLELIVVDDASPTPAATVLAGVGDARLRVVRRKRRGGPAAARNVALRLARTPLVSQLDADDAWEPEYLETIAPCFDDPCVGLAYSNCSIVDHPDGLDTYIPEPAVHPIDWFPKIAEQNPVPALTATMRTEAVRAAGGYASWLLMAEDYHLYLKLARAGWRFAYADRKLARYRWPTTAGGLSYDARRQEREELKMFAAFVARHPFAPGPRRQLRTRARRELRRLLGR
jgi:glycosyltransferase involved in cell wall biosynthesis